MNRFWGRNDEPTNQKLSRDENQLLALNYENLCDSDYLNRLFISSSPEQSEASSNVPDATLTTTTRDHESWILTGETAEDVIIFGDDMALGTRFLEKRFLRDVVSVTKVQDSLSSLVNRQVIVFDHIGKLMVSKCSDGCDEFRKVGIKLGSLASTKPSTKKHLAPELLTCALEALERQSRTYLRRSALEPILSLLVNIFQDYTKANPSISRKPVDLPASQVKQKNATTLAVLGRVQGHLLREILCNGITHAVHALTSRGSTRDRRLVLRDKEELLKLSQCCAYGLLALGVYTCSPADVVMAIFHLTTLSILSSELERDAMLYAASKALIAGNPQARMETGSTQPSAEYVSQQNLPIKPNKGAVALKDYNPNRPSAASLPKSSVATSANNKPDAATKKLKGKVSNGLDGGEMCSSFAPARDPRGDLDVAEDENGKTVKWEKGNQKSVISAEKDMNMKSRLHLVKSRALPEEDDMDSVGPTVMVGYLSTDRMTGEGKQLTAEAMGKFVKTKNNNQAKTVKVSSSVVVLDCAVDAATGRMKSVNNGQQKPIVPPIALSDVISPIQPTKQQGIECLPFKQLLQVMDRVPKSVLRVVQDGSNALLHSESPSSLNQKKSLKDAAYKALIADKTNVFSCGQNSYGELGHGDVNQRKAFSKISCLEGKGIVSVGAGNEHSVFVTKEGKVLVTGYNDNGQCGVGNNQQVKQPTLIQALEGEEIGQVHVYNGCEHTLAVTKDGKLYSFGYNYRGQLGHGTTTSESVPRLVKGLMSRKVIQAACSYHHSIMLCADGALFTCGRNDCGQLGLGDTSDKKTPHLVSSAPKDVTGLSCGQYHTVITTENGLAFVCGKNDYGQLGMEGVDNLKVFTKAQITAESDGVKTVCCGYYHSLFLSFSGIVSGFGRNDYGQLGLGHTLARVHRSQVVTSLRDKNVVFISAGCYHSVTVTSNGMLYVFGRNNHGQLGTGDLEERDLPHPVDDFVGSKIVSVAAGFYHTIVLAVDASVGVSTHFMEDSDEEDLALRAAGTYLQKTHRSSNEETKLTRATQPPPSNSSIMPAVGVSAAAVIGSARSAIKYNGASIGVADEKSRSASIPGTARLSNPLNFQSLAAVLFSSLAPSTATAVTTDKLTAAVASSSSMITSTSPRQMRTARTAAVTNDQSVMTKPTTATVNGFSMENRSKATIRELLAFLVLQLERMVAESPTTVGPDTESSGAANADPESADNRMISWLVRQLGAMASMMELLRLFLGHSQSLELPLAPESALSLLGTLMRTTSRFLQSNRTILLSCCDDAAAKSSSRGAGECGNSSSRCSCNGVGDCACDENKNCQKTADREYETPAEDAVGNASDLLAPPPLRKVCALDLLNEVHAAASMISSGNRGAGVFSEIGRFQRTDSCEGSVSLAESNTTRSYASSVQSATAADCTSLSWTESAGGIASADVTGRADDRLPKDTVSSGDPKKQLVKKGLARLRQELVYIYFHSPEQCDEEEGEGSVLQPLRLCAVADAASCIAKCYEVLFPTLHMRAQLFGALEKAIVVGVSDCDLENSAELDRVTDWLLSLRLFIRISFKYRSSIEVIKLFREKKFQALQIFRHILSVYNHLSFITLESRARKAVLPNNSDVNRALATLEHCNASFVKCAIPLILSADGSSKTLPKGAPATNLCLYDKAWQEIGIAVVKDVFCAAEKVLDVIHRFSLTSDVMNVLRYGTVIPSVLPSILMHGISSARGGSCSCELLALTRSLTRRLQSLSNSCPSVCASSQLNEGNNSHSPCKVATSIVTTSVCGGIRGFGKGDEDLSDGGLVLSSGTKECSTSAASPAPTGSRKDKDVAQVSWWSRLLKLSTILSAKLAASLIYDGHTASAMIKSDDTSSCGAPGDVSTSRTSATPAACDEVINVPTPLGLLSPQTVREDDAVSTSLLLKHPVWRFLACPASPKLQQHLLLPQLTPDTAASSTFQAVSATLKPELVSICELLRAREVATDATYRMLQQVAKMSKTQTLVHGIENTIFSLFLVLNGTGKLPITGGIYAAASAHPIPPPPKNVMFTNTWAAIARLIKNIHSKRAQLQQQQPGLQPSTATSQAGLDWPALLELLYRLVVASAELIISSPKLITNAVPLLLPRQGSKLKPLRRVMMVVICMLRWKTCLRIRLKSFGGVVVSFVDTVLNAVSSSFTDMSSVDIVENRWRTVLSTFQSGTERVEHFTEGIKVFTDSLNEAIYNSMKCDVLAILTIAWRDQLADEQKTTDTRSKVVSSVSSGAPDIALPEPLCCSEDAMRQRASAVSCLVDSVLCIIQDFATTFQSSYTAATAGDFSLLTLSLKFIQLTMIPTGSFIARTTVPLNSTISMVQQLRSIILALDEKVIDCTSLSTDDKTTAIRGNGSGAPKPPVRDRGKAVRRAANAIVSLIQQLAVRERTLAGKLGCPNEADRCGPSTASTQLYNLLVHVSVDVLMHFQRSRIIAARNNHDLDSSGKCGDKDNNSKNKDSSKRRCQEIITKPMEFCRSQEGFVVQGDKLLNNYKGIDFTLAAWVFFTKKSSARHSFVTGKLSHHDAWPLVAFRSDGKLDVIYGHSSDFERLTSAVTIPLTTWTHVAVVVEPKKIKLFINGALDVQTGTKGNSRAVLFPVVVGCCPQGVRTHVDQVRVGFDGLLASFKYYTRALSPIHVRVVYDQGPPESHDRRERWEFQLLATLRVLTESSTGMLSESAMQAAADALHMIFATDNTGRLRCGAVRLLEDILRTDAISSIQLFENKLSSTASIPCTAPIVGININECLFLTEASTFREKLVLYFIRLVGSCWAPVMIASADDSSTTLLAEVTSRQRRGSLTEDASSENRLNELLSFAPMILSEKPQRPSSSSPFSPPTAASVAAMDRLAVREESTGELSFHLITLLRNLMAVDCWNAAISTILGQILAECKAMVDASAEWPLTLLTEVLGSSMLLGGTATGVFLGAPAESYFSDRLCKVLSIYKATNNATLLSWSADGSKRQLSSVRSTDLKSCRMPPLAFVKLSLADGIVDLLESLRKYAQVALTDLICAYRPDHAFARFTLLRSLRPIECLVFHQLLRCISLTREPASIATFTEAIGKNRQLLETLLQIVPRTMWLHSVEEDTQSDLLIPGLWTRSARYIASVPSKVKPSEFPRLESERVFCDYVSKHLGIAVESFQSTPSERMLKQGLFSEVIFSITARGLKLSDGPLGDSNVPSASTATDAHCGAVDNLMLLYDGKYPMTDWTGVPPFGAAYNVRSLIAGTAPGELSDQDATACLRLMYHLRRSVILSARQILTGFVGLVHSSIYAAMPLQGKIALWCGLLPLSPKTIIATETLGDIKSPYTSNTVVGATGIKLVDNHIKCPITTMMFEYLQSNHCLEFTIALASSLRYSAISLKNSSNALESSDLFPRLLTAAEVWLELHEGGKWECDICFQILKMVIPSLLFVKSVMLELKLMIFCRHALHRITLRVLGGHEPSRELLELVKSNNFTQMRARAQEQLSLQKGAIRAEFNPLTHNLTQLVSGLELLQRHLTISSTAYQAPRSMLHPANVVRRPGSACGGTPAKPSLPPLPVGTSNPSVPTKASALRVIGVQATSMEADLTPTAQSAVQAFKDREASLPATCLTALSPRLPTSLPPQSALGTDASVSPMDFVTVEVSLAVIVDGEEPIFDTVYCGSSLRFMQSGLSPNCSYQVRTRASVGGVTVDWSDPVDFHTDTGVFFAFDPLKCGPEIQIGDDGLSASYNGDDSWSTLLCTQGFSSGVVSWEIRVSQSSTAYVFVGVAAAAADLNTFLGGCPNGWGFIGEQALYHNRENVKGYGEAFSAGDVVGVILNFTNGTLSFSRNGKMLGVAFDKIYGELYPAVAFYNMGQELEIIPDSFQASCPVEPTSCSPTRYNMHQISTLHEMLVCIQAGAPLPLHVMAVVAEHCNAWSSAKQKRVKIMTGKHIFVSTDNHLAVLRKYSLGVGERVRTLFGLAEVVGASFNRLWFRFKDSGQVWYFTHQQITSGKEKGLFVRCSYETSPLPSADSNISDAVGPDVSDSVTIITTARKGIIDKAVSSNASAYDIASLQEMLEPGRWSAEMDSVLVTFLVKLADVSGQSPWAVSCDRVLEEFRSLQQQLSRIVLGSVELTHRWGIAGPKRKAVIARMGLLRLLNQQLDMYLPALLLDTSAQALTIEKRTPDEFQPVLTSVCVPHSSLAVAPAAQGNAHEMFLDLTRQRGDESPIFASVTSPAASQISISWKPLGISKLLTVGPLPVTRYRLFPELKMIHFLEVVARSAARPAKTDDDYDYPEDLPQVKINRFKSFRAREASELMGIPGDDLLLSSMFCQLWRELNHVSPEKLRISYTHPMDDGQSRTFKVKFEGEGVDDYGGPYREIFQLICDELLQSDPSADHSIAAHIGGAAAEGIGMTSRAGRGERPSAWATTSAAANAQLKPTRCFLPLLHPTPNWTAGECVERYRYMFRPDATSPLRLDLFKFLGQLVGIAIRSKITLDLPLPSFIWKCVVKEPLNELDIASFDAPASDFVQRLSAIHSRLVALHDANENVDSTRHSVPNVPVSPSLHRKGSSVGFAACTTSPRPTSARVASSMTSMNPPTTTLAHSTSAAAVLAFQEDSDLSHNTIPSLTSEAEALIQDLNWTATRSDGRVIELVSGGSTRPVLVEEIGEYLQLYVQARLGEGAAAISAFTQGLLSIIPESAVILLGWEDLQKIVCGSHSIDIQRLKANTEYDDDVTANDPHILFFWEVLNEFTDEERSAFLRFVWARPTLPPRGVEFPQKMKVQSAVGEDSALKPDQYLPKAHTCFFSINLPRYSSKELMAEKLRYAITHCTEMDADFRLADPDVAGWGLSAQPAWASMSSEE